MTTLVDMPDEKAWEKDGVRITYLCFDTPFSLRVQKVMRAKYLEDDPTPENPDQKLVPGEVYMFYAAMPLIVSVELADGASAWGKHLKREVDAPTWLNDPIADFQRLERSARIELFTEVFEGYMATREQAFVAPEILQRGEPQKPKPNPETGVIDPDALNFSESSTPNGGTPSNVKVLKGRGKSSRVPQQMVK